MLNTEIRHSTKQLPYMTKYIPIWFYINFGFVLSILYLLISFGQTAT